jgi:hypothetical protein
MPNNDFETLARELVANKSGGSAGAMEKIGAMLKTEDGKRLLTLLASGGSDTLKIAAAAALRGDDKTAKTAMISLLSTPEGAALARRLAQALNRS